MVCLLLSIKKFPEARPRNGSEGKPRRGYISSQDGGEYSGERDNRARVNGEERICEVDRWMWEWCDRDRYEGRARMYASSYVVSVGGCVCERRSSTVATLRTRPSSSVSHGNPKGHTLTRSSSPPIRSTPTSAVGAAASDRTTRCRRIFASSAPVLVVVVAIHPPSFRMIIALPVARCPWSPGPAVFRSRSFDH